MKKVSLLLIFISSLFSQSSQFVGTWKLSPIAGAMKVGPNINDGSWWSNSEADVETRACFFDDEYIFQSDGTFENILQTQTWLEEWQGVAFMQCGSPVPPHDASNTATWNYDEGTQTITLSGVGAYLGQPKAITDGEMNLCGCEVPETRTYNVLSIENGIMIVYISTGQGYWTFQFTGGLCFNPNQILGDLDNDGQLTILDINILNSFLFSGSEAGDCFQEVADLNNDEILSIIDLVTPDY